MKKFSVKVRKLPQASTAPCFFASARLVAVTATGGRADDRHDDVADKRVDDGTERGADNDADSEVDDVALHREFAEFLQHC